MLSYSKTLNGLLLAVALCFAAPKASAQSASLTARTVTSDQFCARAIKAFLASGLIRHNEEGAALAQAKAATEALIEILKAPVISQYVPASQLGLSSKSGEGFFSIEALVTAPLGIRRSYIFVRRINDLRYLPLTLEGEHLLLVVSDTNEVTEAQLQKIITAARARRISISVIAPGDSPSEGLARLVQATGGTLVEMRDFHISSCGASP